MNSVWGRGGLFEQAVENKLRNQDADTALKNSQVGVDSMNAGTKSTEVGNNYDLGLRGAGIDAMNADTDRFNADTNRVNVMTATRVGNPTEQTIRELGLSTYGASSTPSPGLLGTTSPTAQSAATPTMFIGRTSGAGRANSFSDRNPLEYKNGGLVMKPKMVQPGYMHGGKITLPKGYENGGVVGSQTPEWVAKSRAETRATPEFRQAIGELTKKGWKPNPKDPESDIDAVDKYLFATKTLPERKAKIGYKAGGKIGDVKKDTGRDTIDAKVRPGEYMLNPETVAHLGGGNYEAGVRNLNQIVREATGKEPGPTPVGKSGKAGFEDSGVLPRNRAPVPVYDPMRGPGPNGFGPVDEAAVRAEQTRYPAVRPYEPNWTTPDPRYGNLNSMGPNDGPSVRERFTRFNNPDVGASIRGGVQRAGAAVRGAAPRVVQGADKGLRVAGKVFTPLAVAADTADVVDVATDPNMAGRDVAGEAAGKAAKWAGATAGAIKGGSAGAALGTAVFPGPGTALGGTVGALGGGALGYFGVDKLIEGGRALRGVETRDPSEYSQGVVSDLLGQQNQPTAAAAVPAKEEAKEKAKPEAAPRDYDKEVADKLAESEPSLRDMMLNRYAMLNDELSRLNPRDQGGATARINQMNDLQKDLTDMENTNTNAAASLLNARGASGNKAVESFRKQATAAFQTDELKDGKPTGKTMFDENAFNLFEASVIAPLAAEGEDFYALPEAERMKLLSAYQDRRRGTDAVMNALSGLRDAPSSRQLINPNQLTEREMNFNDWFDPNSSVDLGALMNSAFRGDDYDKVLEYNTGREKFSLPKTAVSRTASGLRNTDVLRLYGLDKPR